MKIQNCIIGLVSLVVLNSCNDQQLDTTTTATVVVQGYLYAGQSIDSLKISQLLPLRIEEEKSYNIADAEVYIISNGNEYLLTPSTDIEGDYYYDDNDLDISAGETYELRLDHFGKTVTATTTTPPAPAGLRLSANEIEMVQILSIEDLFNRGEASNLEIYWDNENADYYYLVVENIEDNPEEINQLDFDRFQNANFNFTTQPTNLDVSNVNPFTLTQYGTYRVVLYRVNQEYVDLYETAEQDSRSLAEPLSNIENGLGIFTSFNSDTVYFNVVKP